MSDAPEILDHNGVRYVPEVDFLEVQQKYNDLKQLVSGFVDQAAEQDIQQRRVRRRTAPE